MTVFTIPPGTPFVDALARGLLDIAGGEPLALAEQLVLLPTRRAARALREAFLRLGEGRPMLLPRMLPLGDVDEDELALTADGPGEGLLDLPPAVPPLRRQLLLTRLVIALGGGRGGRAPSADQAARLAGELGAPLDQVQTEGLDFSALAGLVPAYYAAHWQITLDFLKLLTEHWPRLLAEQGFLDAAERRVRLIDAQAQAWAAAPPAHPVIAAGSTGSVPATARLLKVVAGLPRGRVVLPGLDRHMDAESWAVLDPAHPQFGLKRLLDGMALSPGEVADWPGAEPPRCDRSGLVSEAMRPAATSDAWRRLPAADPGMLDGLTRLDCPGPREEAGAIALVLRQALEVEGRTAALVTPDRSLARRVAGELGRWGIGLDDSAGRSLAATVPGAFLRLVAAMAVEDFAPLPLLAALKHPLAAGGIDPAVFRARVRRLEIVALRGPRPASGLAGLKAAAGPELAPWLDGLAAAAAPFAALVARPEASLADLVRAHVACAEALAGDGRQPGAARLWAGEAGEAAAAFVADLVDAAAALPALPGRAYAALLEALIDGRAVRPAWGGHPRLHVWGPLEARLQQVDLLVLGGLNEGTWPPEPAADPWMSRPMRQAFGLPAPERRIGLAAHDFAQGFCAPQVVLTRAARVEGTPTVPSRWLLRLDAVLRAAGLAASGTWAAASWLDWFRRLDRPQRPRPGQPPAPCPPLVARPRRLSATEIETWMRDPYAIYAKRILRLKALDPLDADPGAADYGSLVHDALDRFLKAHPAGPLPADALARLVAIGEEVFAPALARPGVWAFWWPRFLSVARWFIDAESARRPGLAASWSEISGAIDLVGPAGPLVVTAKADRVDLLADGSLAIIDYKTGAPPSAREVAAGFAPQLPIEAAIARHGGFAEAGARPVTELLYWRLKGGVEGGEERPAGDDPAALAAQALDGLARLIAAFDDDATPYAARPHPERAPRYSDYLHLARVKEWASAGGDEGE